MSDPASITSNGSAETLWCLHAIGPDDLHAAPSREEADRACTWYTERFKDATEVAFEVIPWPYTLESHALDLQKWATEVRP